MHQTVYCIDIGYLINAMLGLILYFKRNVEPSVNTALRALPETKEFLLVISFSADDPQRSLSVQQFEVFVVVFNFSSILQNLKFKI